MQNPNFRARLDRIAHTMLDGVGAILDIVERRDAPGGPLTPALACVSRWANNQFGLWRRCAKPACRRAQGCRGEPRACLTRHAPQLPPAERSRVHILLRAARANTGAVAPE